MHSGCLRIHATVAKWICRAAGRHKHALSMRLDELSAEPTGQFVWNEAHKLANAVMNFQNASAIKSAEFLKAHRCLVLN